MIRSCAVFRLMTMLLVLYQPSMSRAAELIMVDQKNCYWCRKWDAEIGTTYDSTPVGRIAPLRRVDLHEPKPADLAHINLGRATPVFILMENGAEVGRVRGYPGKEMFWQLLREELVKLPSLQQQAPQPDVSQTGYALSRK